MPHDFPAAGGFLAVAYGRWRDWVAEKTRFKAAVLVVLDELGANEVNIEGLLNGKAPKLEVYDATYRSVELVLAQRSSTRDRELTAEAYAPLRSRWAGEIRSGSMDWTNMQWAEWVKPNKEALAAALEKIKGAQIALAAYLAAGPPSSRTRQVFARVLCRMGLHDRQLVAGEADDRVGICRRCGRVREVKPT